MKTLLFLLLASAALADPTHYVVRLDAQGTVLESCPTSTPTTNSVGLPGPGESVAIVPWVDLAGHPTIKEPAEALDARVPTLRVVNGKIRQRLKADVDADVAKARSRKRIDRRIEAKARRLAAEAVASELPDDPDAQAAAAKAREDEAR